MLCCLLSTVCCQASADTCRQFLSSCSAYDAGDGVTSIRTLSGASIGPRQTSIKTRQATYRRLPSHHSQHSSRAALLAPHGQQAYAGGISCPSQASANVSSRGAYLARSTCPVDRGSLDPLRSLKVLRKALSISALPGVVHLFIQHSAALTEDCPPIPDRYHASRQAGGHGFANQSKERNGREGIIRRGPSRKDPLSVSHECFHDPLGTVPQHHTTVYLLSR